MQKTCKEDFDIDADGTLVVNPNFFYGSTVAKYTSSLGLLGLYLGQIMFSYTSGNRLSLDSYTTKRIVYLFKLTFSVIFVCLWMLP